MFGGKIAIIGLGFVGGSMDKSFRQKIHDGGLHEKYNIVGYDKYKKVYNTTINDCLNANIIFTALPTLFDTSNKGYDNTPTIDVITELYENGYRGCVVIKSTVEPTFTENLANKFVGISFVHNPEFLTARTAYEDFHNQTHIVLGKHSQCNNDVFALLKQFYSDLYPSALISDCNTNESECMKIFCNTFYSVKIQYFNELYALSNSIGASYDVVLKLMLQNGWINSMHTQVPGPDGLLSYGGLCFTKDTMALLEFMKKSNTIHAVLDATVEERTMMRSDNDNLK
jgi:UDP-glucose 6-dehydrogenase